MARTGFTALDVARAAADTLNEKLAELAPAYDRLARRSEELDQAAGVLRTFYLSTVSLSAIQPILDLAVRLNPGLIDELNRQAATAADDPRRV